MDVELLSLIDRYWDLAYTEGKEGRDHDTEEGDAALCRYEIEKRIRELNRHGAGDAGHSPDAGKMGEAEEGSLRFIAKRNLRRMIEIGSTDKVTMLLCLEELS